MKILLTGGAGYIGSHTAVELISQGYTVDIVDNLYNSKLSAIDNIEKITKTRPSFYEVDLTNAEALEKLFADNNYDTVIHFAGLKAAAESIAMPLKYYENNLVSTLNLLKLMKKYSVKNLIFSSSATVYGAQNKSRLTETDSVGQNITNPYGQTKYMIERILNDFSNANPDFCITVLRYFNPIGAHPSGLIGEDPNDIPNNLMPIVAKVYTGEIDRLSVYGNNYDTPDGTCMRDFIHVVDLAKGHIATLRHFTPGVSVYNLGTGKPSSVLEVIKTFEEVSGKSLNYEIAARRPGDIAICYADPTKAEKELNWKAELTVRDATTDLINFVKKSAIS